MATDTLTLTDFLLARIAGDEAVAREASGPDTFGEQRTYYSDPGPHRDDWGVWTLNFQPARVLADCEAKRRIVEWESEWAVLHSVEVEQTNGWFHLRFLALPYADHPDYRDEWRA